MRQQSLLHFYETLHLVRSQTTSIMLNSRCRCIQYYNFEFLSTKKRINVKFNIVRQTTYSIIALRLYKIVYFVPKNIIIFDVKLLEIINYFQQEQFETFNLLYKHFLRFYN